MEFNPIFVIEKNKDYDINSVLTKKRCWKNRISIINTNIEHHSYSKIHMELEKLSKK